MTHLRILLDTSYLYGLAASPFLFSGAERRLLDDPGNDLFASAASLWEMRLKHQRRHKSGARKSAVDPVAVIEMLNDHAINLLALSPAHATAPLDVPLRHKDPFDEILLVQAQEEGLRLLTVDRALLSHPLAFAA